MLWQLKKGATYCSVLGLASLYRAQFNTGQHPQGKEEENRPTGTVA